MRCLWQAELDPYASRVLAKHWPDIPNHGDVNHIDWGTVHPVDVICGGYPCQPFSLSGDRAGRDDPRHLWPRFADAIRILRPRYALLENVPGHLSLGFGEVLADLSALRYDTEWDCIPAAAVGAPHRRDRVFVIATRQDLAHPDSSFGEGDRLPIRGATEHTDPHLRCAGRKLWPTEPDLPRMANGVPNLVDRLRGLGNAVVPQVAEYVGRRILEIDATK